MALTVLGALAEKNLESKFKTTTTTTFRDRKRAYVIIKMPFLENLRNQQIVQRISNPSGDGGTLEHSRLAQRSGSDLFFAHQSSIRCSKISESESYKVLDTPEVQFVIKGIKINSSGTLLAIYNESNLVVTCLPSSEFMKTPDSLIKVKSFVIGDHILNKTKIVDLQWNCLARFDSSVVVLSEDGAIRTFNIDSSVEEPDMLYHLKNSHINQVGYATDVMDDPVSISFGSCSTLSGSLTLYILNSDGDIFSIYPFIPKQIVVSKSQVEDLLNETVLITTNNIESDNTFQKRSSINQLRFVKYLWEQLPTAPFEIRDSDKLSVLQPDSKDKMMIQGPFTIQPYPDSLYSDSALSISTIKCGLVDILAVTFSHKGFLLLLPDVSATMRFKEEDFEDYVMLNETAAFSPVLTTLEFKSSQTSSATHIASCSDLSCFFIQRGNVIYKASLKKLQKNLNEACIRADIDSLTELLNSGFKSELQEFCSLRTKETYEGMCILQNEHSELFAAILTSLNFHIFALSDIEPNRRKPIITHESGTVYSAKLGMPFFEIEKMVRDARNTSIKRPSNSISEIKNDETGLRGLSDVSSQVLQSLVLFHKVGVSLNHRVDCQKHELYRQLSTSHDILNRFEVVEKKKETNAGALQKTFERQNSLNKRIQALAETLHQGTDLPLTVNERSWFREIHSLTMSFNQSAKQYNTLHQQLSMIRGEIDSRKFAPGPDSYGLQNWEEIQSVLEQGKKVIEGTTLNLQQNISRLESDLRNTYV